MKLRTGFVSNSSSSSFIIAKKPTTPSIVKIPITVDFTKYTDKVIHNVEELSKWVEDWWGGDIDAKKLAEYQELLAKGYEIHVGSFEDQSGDSVELFLCMNGIPHSIPKRIKIIQSEGGY